MAGKFIHYAIASLTLIGVVKMIDQVQASPEKSTPFCHERDVQGQVTDLSSLCQMNPSLPSPSPVASPTPTASPIPVASTKPKPVVKPKPVAKPMAVKPSRPAPKLRTVAKVRVSLPKDAGPVEFSNVRYDVPTNRLLGTVKNKSRDSLEGGGFRYEIRTSGDRVNWKTGEKGRVCFQDRAIPGRKSSSFKSWVPVNPSGSTVITITQVDAEMCPS